MATDLTGKSVSSTYNQLLHVDGGPTNEEKTVYGGAGAATALKVSTESVSVDNVRIDGNTITTVVPNSDLVLAPDGAGKVQITNAVITGGIFYGNNMFSGSNIFPSPTTAGNPLIRGHSVPLPNGVDLNTVVDTGFYRLENNLVNAPVLVDYGQLIVSRGKDTVLQIVTGYGNGEIYWRQGNPPEAGGSRTWSPWHRFFHSGNLPGSLSNNGWQLLPGGLLIQWGAANLGSNLQAPVGGASVIGYITFPIAFPTRPFSASVVGYVPGSTGNEVIENFLSVQNITSSNLIVAATRVSGSGAEIETLSVSWIAIGH